VKLSPCWCLAVLLVLVPSAKSALPAPPSGHFYHGVYPGGITGEEDDLTLADLESYEKTVGKHAAWVYFSDNWYAGRKFPEATAEWVRKAGAVPFIRLMLRSENHKSGHGEKAFSLQAIIDGKFDADLLAWGQAAKAFGTPLIVEYGTEVNAEWFGWNGSFHGGGEKKKFGRADLADGPERFVAAYRHIVETIRRAGAKNITWVFHLDVTQWPEAAWNRFENYYPGDDVVDWIGVSCYGPQNPRDDESEKESFREKFDPIYPRIEKLAPNKPIMIVEFGATKGFPYITAAAWAQSALGDILSGRWPGVRGFSWWNEKWENDNKRKNDTTMRVQDDADLCHVFREALSAHPGIVVERISH